MDSIRNKPIEIVVDDITLVTALKCDSRIRTDYVEIDEKDEPRRAHCKWVLSAIGLSEDELNSIIAFIKKDGGKQGKKKHFTWHCPECGLDWIDNGACGNDCTGHIPDYYRYDESKRIVIEEKRKAQEELHKDKTNNKEAKLYEN